MAAYEKALELEPEMARAHYRLGLAYLSAGELERARNHLTRFIELQPEDPEAATAREMLGYLR